MALDGSFTCEAALRRFLARCPELCSNPKFVSLLQKERPISAVDTVSVVADPFLHPRYTIPIVGCFRPICRKILHKVVEKLHSVGSFDSEFEEDVEEIGEDDIHVIDFYVRRRRKMKLHELACLAFCRALDLAPFLLSFLLSYFQFAPPPFRRLLSLGIKLPSKEIDSSIVDTVRVSYRLLLLEPKVFSELWDWSTFLDLVQYIYSPRMQTAGPVFTNLLDTRWCLIQILSVTMKYSDRVILNGLSVEEAFLCLLRWEEFCQDTSVEKAGCYLKDSEVKAETNVIEPVNLYQYIESFEQGSYSFDSGSQKKHKNTFLCGQQSLAGKFFLTTAVKRSFESVLIAVSQKWPVLLYGPAGSGKTALINELAFKSGSRVLFIHVDEQMDCKSLIGSYISSDQPGEFKWQPGSLTQALLGGLWVVFEELDKAPNELQSIILPLLEGSSSFVTGHGEVIEPQESPLEDDDSVEPQETTATATRRQVMTIDE